MKKGIISLLLAAGLTLPAMAQEGYQPTPENLQARQTFQDNKFGIFLHYGIYSMMADGEWVMNNRNLNWEEYAKLAGGFYPANFNAAEWVAVGYQMGCVDLPFGDELHDFVAVAGIDAAGLERQVLAIHPRQRQYLFLFV